MKRFLPFLAIVLFAVVSCEDPDVNVDKNDSRKISTFEATIVESLSRTQSTILSDGDLYTRWHSEDVVALTNGIKSAKYNIKSGSGSATANFSVAADSRSVSFAQTDVIYGVSPASALSLKNSKSKLAVEIPSAQTYTGVAGQNDNARNIMLGLSDENLEPLSLLRFSLLFVSILRWLMMSKSSRYLCRVRVLLSLEVLISICARYQSQQQLLIISL